MRTIALISGGLDSILAAKVVKDQGVEVVPLKFRIPFCHRDDNKAGELIKKIGLDLQTVEINEDFLEIIKKPRYGFGSNMNPCIDCKILMLAKTRELMPEFGASFVVTGEVLGQRPMSQHKQALEIIEKRSGLEGLVLRPLSAMLLKETIPEKENWVIRNRLLNFSGRSRKSQVELARSFGLTGYPNPAGGCLLTDPQFALRLKELIAHQELNLDNVKLLKLGRHFRVARGAKLVVGRNEKEGQELLQYARGGDYLFMPPEELAGPTCLGRGKFSEEAIRLACSIICRYCDLDGAESVGIVYRVFPEAEAKTLKIRPAEEEEIKNLRI